MTPRLRELTAELEQAKHNLEHAIMVELDRVARANNVQIMTFYLTTHLQIDGEWHDADAVEEIAALDYFYCDNIHPNGFQGTWSAKKGWE